MPAADVLPPDPAVGRLVGAPRDAEAILAEMTRWPPRVFLDAGLLARQCQLPLSRVRAALDRLAATGALDAGRTREPRTYRLVR